LPAEPETKSRKKMTEELKKEIIAYFRSKKKNSRKEIAERFNITTYQVDRLIDKYLFDKKNKMN